MQRAYDLMTIINQTKPTYPVYPVRKAGLGVGKMYADLTPALRVEWLFPRHTTDTPDLNITRSSA